MRTLHERENQRRVVVLELRHSAGGRLEARVDRCPSQGFASQWWVVPDDVTVAAGLVEAYRA